MVQQIASQPDIFRLAFHHPTSLLANSHVDIDDKGHFSISFFFSFWREKMLEEIWRCSLSSFSFVCVFSLLCWTRGNLRYRTFDWLQDSDRIFSKIWPVCRQEGTVSRQVYLFHPAKGGKVIVFLFSLETFPEEEDEEEEEEPSGHIWTLPPYFYLTSPGSVLVLFYFYILVLCLSCGPPPTTSLAVSTFFILFLTPPSNERAICLVPFVAFRFFFCEDNFIKKKKRIWVVQLWPF